MLRFLVSDTLGGYAAFYPYSAPPGADLSYLFAFRGLRPTVIEI
mgnify:FL=1